MTVVSRNRLAGKQLRQVRADDVLEQHERAAVAAGDLHQPRSPAGTCTIARRRSVSSGAALEQQREIEAERRQQRERPRHVDRQRRQHRQHARRGRTSPARRAAHRLELRDGERCRMPCCGERRQQLVVDQADRATRPTHARVRADRGQLLARRQAREIRRRVALFDRALEAGDAHHEELVEIRRGDRRELDPLEQRRRRVGRFLEHALVEREPRQLAVDEAARRGRPASSRDDSRRPDDELPSERLRRTCRRARSPPAAPS